MTSTCIWCSQPYELRRDGGKRQRFCSKPCRVSFFAAARTWALMMVEQGTVTIDEIRRALPATCTLQGMASEHQRVPEQRGGEKATLEPWRASVAELATVLEGDVA